MTDVSVSDHEHALIRPHLRGVIGITVSGVRCDSTLEQGVASLDTVYHVWREVEMQDAGRWIGPALRRGASWLKEWASRCRG